MANLTDKNIKTLSQIETIDANEEQNAFFLCGKGERLKKINFDRLRRKVNGTILPTKKPDNTKLGELWLEGTKIEDKAEKESLLLAKNKDFETPYIFENFVRVDENTYFLRDKIPYKRLVVTDGTITTISYQPIFSDGLTFDFIVFTKNLIVFFNKADVTLSRAIVRETLKEITINENFTGAIPYEVLQIVNATYPMENANGVLFDDSDNMTFRFLSFDLLADGETFGYSEVTSLDYSELGTVNGAKAVVKANVTNSENEILILPKVDGVYCYGDQVICNHDIKLSFIRDFGEGEKTLFIFVGENQASVYNNATKEIETLSLFSDSTTLAEVVSGAETLNGFYLLQKTTTENLFSIVKYSVDDNNEMTIEKLREWNSKENGQGENILVDFVSFIIDTKQAMLQLDGEKPEPNFYFISTKRRYSDNSHGLYTNYVDEILSSIYEYKMMLAYGENYQEIQGYKGEQGEVSTKKLNDTVNNAIARVVADAPEDFDTLKEMSDWISTHEDDATAMNTAIAENKTAIATETETRIAQDEILSNLISSLSTSLDNSILFGENFIKFTKSKIAVVWGEHKNLVTTANIGLPFHFANTSFTVFLTATRNGLAVTSLWEGDESGNKTRDTNHFKMSCKRDLSYDVNVAYLVIGVYQ